MKTVIIGAGVAGLTAAHVLCEAGTDVIVLEAASQVGGRVRSLHDAAGQYLGDLGPSWVWPPYQPYLSNWLDNLGLSTIEQYEQGNGCVEHGREQAIQHLPLPVQHGQRRPMGGPQAIINALLKGVPDDAIHLNAQAKRVTQTAGQVSILTANEMEYTADQLLLAAPLRIIRQDISFDPPLNAEVLKTMAESPTWMAAQAKALVVYEKPFWRTQGFSGRIASVVGPLVEAHDHSGIDGSPAALVGFIGLDATSRSMIASKHGSETLQLAVIEQLVRCFGQEAYHPLYVRIEDWANDPFIATQQDRMRPGDHPVVLPELIRQAHVNDRVQFAVAETANVSPGLLEGAMVAGQLAANNAIDAFQSVLQSSV